MKFSFEFFTKICAEIKEVWNSFTSYKEKRTQKKEEQLKAQIDQLKELSSRLDKISFPQISSEFVTVRSATTQYNKLYSIIIDYILLSQGSFRGIKAGSECENQFRDSFEYLQQIYKERIAYNPEEFAEFYKDIYSEFAQILFHEICYFYAETSASSSGPGSGPGSDSDQGNVCTFGNHSQSAWFINLHKLAGSTA